MPALPCPSADRRIEVAVDPGNAVVETEERNNRVGFDSDAISVGLYVERSVYNYFDAHQRELGVGSISCEDWAKRLEDWRGHTGQGEHERRVTLR
ncbi:hypothetical protein [Sorangium sp. So ce341]|uniref:hypothetical protein n=1 Tax=Sorangium sp. So ce341 TaxID=3133302 RepID=UPI003F614F91